MEPLSEVENKSPKSLQSLHLLYILRGWIGLHLTKHCFWDSTHLTQMTPKMLQRCLGLEFSLGSPLISITDIPTKAEPETSLHVLTSILCVTGPFYWHGEGEQQQLPSSHPMT